MQIDNDKEQVEKEKIQNVLFEEKKIPGSIKRLKKRLMLS